MRSKVCVFYKIWVQRRARFLKIGAGEYLVLHTFERVVPIRSIAPNLRRVLVIFVVT